MRKLAVLLLAVGPLGGCAGAGEADRAVVRRDSAGVEIVETATEVWTDRTRWTVDSEPLVSIGLTEGDERYLFGDISGVLRLDDGTVVVGDAQSRLIRFYDADGVFLRQVGGAGGGPTEFGSLADVWLCGSNLVYGHDRSGQRVKVWNGEGEFQRDFPLLEPGQAARGPYRTACSPSGEFLVAGWGDLSRMPRDRTQFYSQSAPIWLLDSGGQPLLELGEYVISDRIAIVNANGGGGSGPHPFGRSASFAIVDSTIFIGTAERLDVQVYDRGGRLIGSMRGPPIDLTIDDALLDRYGTAELAGSAAGLVDLIREQGLAMPDGYAAYSQFRVDPDGNLWVQRFRFPWDESERWGVFSADGAFLGHVEMPEGFSVSQIGRDRVLGVARDELDVQRVRMYRLNRPQERGS